MAKATPTSMEMQIQPKATRKPRTVAAAFALLFLGCAMLPGSFAIATAQAQAACDNIFTPEERRRMSADAKADDAAAARTRQKFIGETPFRKGGLGTIERDLRVVISASNPNNELVLANSVRWTGKSKKVRQIVYFFNNAVYDLTKGQPKHFSVKEAVLISFEEDKVYYFNFATCRGGFYKRD